MENGILKCFCLSLAHNAMPYYPQAKLRNSSADFSLTLCMLLLAALLNLNSCERLLSLWERCLPVLGRIKHAPST